MLAVTRSSADLHITLSLGVTAAGTGDALISRHYPINDINSLISLSGLRSVYNNFSSHAVKNGNYLAASKWLTADWIFFSPYFREMRSRGQPPSHLIGKSVAR